MTQCKRPQDAEGRGWEESLVMKSLVMPAGVGGEGSGRCPAKSAALPDTRSQPAHSTAPLLRAWPV